MSSESFTTPSSPSYSPSPEPPKTRLPSFNAQERSTSHYEPPAFHKCTNARGHPKTYACSYCSDTFISKKHWEQHLVKLHRRKFTCEKCGKQYTREHKLKAHTCASCAALTTYTCSYCSDTFTSKDQWEQNLVRLHGRKFTCERCGKKYTRESTLKKHTCGVPLAAEATTTFKCPYCPETASNKWRWEQHVVMVHNPGFVCERCGKEYTWQHSLERHLRTCVSGI